MKGGRTRIRCRPQGTGPHRPSWVKFYLYIWSQRPEEVSLNVARAITKRTYLYLRIFTLDTECMSNVRGGTKSERDFPILTNSSKPLGRGVGKAASAYTTCKMIYVACGDHSQWRAQLHMWYAERRTCCA